MEAVEVCRKRCWKYDWVIDLDVASFFDSVRHDLIVKAVEAHTDAPWVLLYVKRWLVAPVQQPDGSLLQRDQGTPQGSAVSPVLANLFLYYALDAWMQRTYPRVPFERYRRRRGALRQRTPGPPRAGRDRRAFRPRGARRKDGRIFLGFAPAISKDALTKISGEVRSWRLHRRTNLAFAELARTINRSCAAG